MTPEDYELMNNMLIAQSGRDEIVIQQQAETIRDLEAEIRRLKTENAELRIAAPYVRKWG